MSLSRTFGLKSGLDLEAAVEVCRKANLTLPLIGANTVYTSFGDNLAHRAVAELARRGLRADVGAAALTIEPTATGLTASLPAQDLLLDGRVIPLSGPASSTAPLAFDMSGLADGQYAVILETWTSLVGATTTSASFPAGFPGVTNVTNKPSSTTLFAGGNPLRTDAVAESALVDATLEVRRFLQPQYRTRVIADASLTGLLAFGSGAAYADPAGNPLAPYGVTATEATSALAHDQKVHAVKLFLVRKLAGVLTVATGTSLASSGLTATGQSPVPSIPTRTSGASRLAAVEASLAASVTLEATRVVGTASGPAFAADWGSIGGNRLEFWKDANGVVSFGGSAYCSAEITAGATKTVFYLPTGYYRTGTQFFGLANAYRTSPDPIRVTVEADGRLHVQPFSTIPSATTFIFASMVYRP